ncbi:hypothetical protein JCM17380_16490 [Desulfosporosinus burensis]
MVKLEKANELLNHTSRQMLLLSLIMRVVTHHHFYDNKSRVIINRFILDELPRLSLFRLLYAN